MEQKKPRDHFHIVITFLCVMVAIAGTAIVYSYQIDGLQNLLIDAKAAKLVNVNLGYTDNGQGTLHITGYVYNTGTQTAYSSRIRVDLYSGNDKTNSTEIWIGKDASDNLFGATIAGGNSFFMDQNVTYEGNSPTNLTFTLGWINSWDIPVPAVP